MFALMFFMQHIPFDEGKMYYEMIFKCMCMYTKGGKKENMVHGYHKQAKQLKTFHHAQNTMANKPIKYYHLYAILCAIKTL